MVCLPGRTELQLSTHSQRILGRRNYSQPVETISWGKPGVFESTLPAAAFQPSSLLTVQGHPGLLPGSEEEWFPRWVPVPPAPCNAEELQLEVQATRRVAEDAS